MIAKWLFLDQSDIFIVDMGASADESADLKDPASTGFGLLYFHRLSTFPYFHSFFILKERNGSSSQIQISLITLP